MGIVVILSCLLIAADEVPDPDYIPRTGDKIVVHTSDGKTAPVFLDITEHAAWAKAKVANDDAGMKLAEKKALKVKDGTGILVYKLNTTYDIDALEARIQDGKYKDKLVFVPKPYFAKMIPKKSRK